MRRYRLCIVAVITAATWMGFMGFPSAKQACAQEVEAQPAEDADEAPAGESASEGEDSGEEGAGEESAGEESGKDGDGAAKTAKELWHDRLKLDWMSGTFEASFDGIWSSDDSDINLEQYLDLHIDPPKKEGLRFRGALWMHEDLDSDEDRDSVLRDINDAYDSDVQARLLYLYAEFEDAVDRSTLRIGRQRIRDGAAYNRIDGLYFKKHIGAWEWYAFGGARASIYEDRHDDGVLGGGLALRPADSTRVALDAYYAEESRDGSDVVRRGPLVNLLRLPYPREVKKDIEDTELALSIWHNFNPNFRMFGRFTWQDNGGDELTLNFDGYVPNWDLYYSFNYTRLLDTLGDTVNDLSRYYRILGKYEEYQNFFASLHKPVTEKVTLSLEAEVRDVQNDSYSTINRDYQRYALIVSVDELAPGLDASSALALWDADGGEGYWAVTGEMTKEWEAIALTIGADYERYEDRVVDYNPFPYWIDQTLIAVTPGVYQRYNPLVYLTDTRYVDTHENIHSIYTKLKWEFRENQDVTMEVTYEEDDEPDSPYWRLQAGYAIRF